MGGVVGEEQNPGQSFTPYFSNSVFLDKSLQVEENLSVTPSLTSLDASQKSYSAPVVHAVSHAVTTF